MSTRPSQHLQFKYEHVQNIINSLQDQMEDLELCKRNTASCQLDISEALSELRNIVNDTSRNDHAIADARAETEELIEVLRNEQTGLLILEQRARDELKLRLRPFYDNRTGSSPATSDRFDKLTFAKALEYKRLVDNAWLNNHAKYNAENSATTGMREAETRLVLAARHMELAIREYEESKTRMQSQVKRLQAAQNATKVAEKKFDELIARRFPQSSAQHSQADVHVSFA